MFDATPDIRAIHSEFGRGVQRLSPEGGAFVGVFAETDRSAFDSAIVGEHALRYLAADADLAPGDVLEIDGQSYQVADTPQRLNRWEMLAQLVEGAGDPPEEEEGGD